MVMVRLRSLIDIYYQYLGGRISFGIGQRYFAAQQYLSKNYGYIERYLAALKLRIRSDFGDRQPLV